MNRAASEFLTRNLGHDAASVAAGHFWPVELSIDGLPQAVGEGWGPSGRAVRFPGRDGVTHRLSLRAERIGSPDRPAFLFLPGVRAAQGPDSVGADDHIRRLDRAQALSQTGSWEWDIVTNDLSWSDEIYRIFGLTPQVFGASYPAFLSSVHPDDRAAVEEAVSRAVEEARPYDIDHRIIRPDGEVRFVRERGEVERNADGKAIRMLGAVQDVTDLRRVERSAARNRDMLSGMFRISPEAIIVANEQSRILVFSVGAEAVFGYKAHEIVGERIERLMPERYRHSHDRHVERFASGGVDSLQMAQRRPVRGLRKDGKEIPIEASLARIRAGGEVLFTTIVRDLSERYETEAHLIEARDQAQEASRAKSAFLANMSHELRTPLNGVLGVAGALARTTLDPRQSEMVQLIETSGRALQALLTDILDLAQVEAGRLEIGKDPFDLGQMVRDAADLFSPSAGDKGLFFDLVLPASARRGFLGDEKRMRQVLNNLLSNAIKFTDQGRVILSVEAPVWREGGSWIRLQVEDTGIGFGDEVKARLFDRFEQADSSITRRFGGTGLGLAICKALVQLMGGTIDARSTPGVGSTFTVEIPAEPVAVETVGEGADALDGELAGRPPRVLLAEDHPTNRRVVEFIMEPLGVDMTSVENGEEAVAAAAAQAFDLILMDMQMPVMDGVEAVRRIRAAERGKGLPRTPICMLTANALPQHRDLSIEAGADDFLTKPISAEALISKVIAAVDHAQASAA